MYFRGLFYISIYHHSWTLPDQSTITSCWILFFCFKNFCSSVTFCDHIGRFLESTPNAGFGITGVDFGQSILSNSGNQRQRTASKYDWCYKFARDWQNSGRYWTVGKIKTEWMIFICHFCISLLHNVQKIHNIFLLNYYIILLCIGSFSRDQLTLLISKFGWLAKY